MLMKTEDKPDLNSQENDDAELMEMQRPTEESAKEQCVPVEFLSQPDENDHMTTPTEGEDITMQVEAVITRIENGKAYFTPKAINGNVLKEESETPTPEDSEETGNGLRDEAEKMSLAQEAGQ